MGDRANFGFKQSNGQTIMLYGHWAGHDMLHNLAAAVLRATPRWDDEGYATRIVISNLVGNDWNQETGWGLYVNTIADNEHKIPIINWKDKTFSLHEEESWDVPSEVRGMKDEPLFTMSLDSFVDKYYRSI